MTDGLVVSMLFKAIACFVIIITQIFIVGTALTSMYKELNLDVKVGTSPAKDAFGLLIFLVFVVEIPTTFFAVNGLWNAFP